MFIIFDLDDTIIDTSGCITPFKLKACAEFFGVDPAKLLDENLKLERAKDAVISFAKKNNLISSLDEALSILSRPLPSSFKVPLTPHAKEVLIELKKRGQLGLVTMGSKQFQEEKLKKSGIDCSLFSMIRILERPEKSKAYVEIQEKFSLSPKDIWVCGDRIETDLAPAHVLGYHTIHMRWGRGKREKREGWIDHSIEDLEELKDIIQ